MPAHFSPRSANRYREPRPIPGSGPGDLPTLWSSDGRTTWKTLMPADKAGLLDMAFVGLSGFASWMDLPGARRNISGPSGMARSG